MKKLSIGDIVYSLNVGNAARHIEQKLTKCEVVKVGNKYFEISPTDSDWKWKEKFHIDGWNQVTECSASHSLYETEQEWIDEKEKNNLITKIRAVFANYGNPKITLDAARKIVEILNSEINNGNR